MLLNGHEVSLVFHSIAVLKKMVSCTYRNTFQEMWCHDTKYCLEDQMRLWKVNNQKGETSVLNNHNRNNFIAVMGDSEINVG